MFQVQHEQMQRGEEAHHTCPIFQEKTKLHEEPGEIKLERPPDHQFYISTTFSNQNSALPWGNWQFFQSDDCDLFIFCNTGPGVKCPPRSIPLADHCHSLKPLLSEFQVIKICYPLSLLIVVTNCKLLVPCYSRLLSNITQLSKFFSGFKSM